MPTSVTDEELRALVQRVTEAAGALIAGDIRRYVALITHADDYTLHAIATHEARAFRERSAWRRPPKCPPALPADRSGRRVPTVWPRQAGPSARSTRPRGEAQVPGGGSGLGRRADAARTSTPAPPHHAVMTSSTTALSSYQPTKSVNSSPARIKGAAITNAGFSGHRTNSPSFRPGGGPSLHRGLFSAPRAPERADLAAAMCETGAPESATE